MAKPIQELKIYTLKAMYKDYAGKLLKDNPTWWGVTNRVLKMKNCVICSQTIRKGSKWTPEELRGKNEIVVKMSWQMYKNIVESYFHKAKQAIIHGETLNIPNVGKILAVRVQRNFNRKIVDWGATLQSKKTDGINAKMIFHTDEDYCKIEWATDAAVTGANVRSYHFTPAGKNVINNKGFKKEFVDALMEDQFLKFKYKYYPLIDIKALIQCNTNTQASKTLLET